MIAFGPVPSRRLGFSLGINHIPPKHCPYSCIYCQVGRTTSLETKRRSFYPLDQIYADVDQKIAETIQSGQVIDYLSLVPDGEPTLDLHLGELIMGLKCFKIPIAVISNAALIDRPDVRDALMPADWVSLKVDAVIEADWRRINRPYRRLLLSSILAGIRIFREKFQGKLVTETLLISGVNDSVPAIRELADYLVDLQPDKSYLSIPTRPPAESWVKPPDAETLQAILPIITERVSFIDLLFDTEVGDFLASGAIVEDILSITAVHPIREEALRKMVAQAGADWVIVEELLASKKITCIQYRQENFYIRCFHG